MSRVTVGLAGTGSSKRVDWIVPNAGNTLELPFSRYRSAGAYSFVAFLTIRTEALEKSSRLHVCALKRS
jgi:hypothetical protein